MLTSRDVDFLEGRVAEEMRYAHEASDPSAALVHRKMAALYSTRIIELRAQTPATDAIARPLSIN